MTSAEGRNWQPALPHLGARLRRLRRIRGLKQCVVAELAGVTQSTISRWEKGELQPDVILARRVLLKLAGGGSQLSDGRLRDVVESSPLRIHMIRDIDHRLLAASRSREREWGQSAAELLGESLWRYATQPIRAAETALENAGWWNESVTVPVTVNIGAGHAGLNIEPGLMVWERLHLADGTPVRLCTNVGQI